jgi:hypothetical protein
MGSPERTPVPESEVAPPILWPDQREVGSFTPGMRVVGFVLVDHEVMQLREGAAIGWGENYIDVHFDQKLPITMRENGSGREASAVVRRFHVRNISLFRKVDYNMLRSNPQHIAEWISRKEPGDLTDPDYLAKKLEGVGIETANPGLGKQRAVQMRPTQRPQFR